MALLYIECIKLSHYFMLKNILVSLCHCSHGCLHMLVCASKLMRWQIVNVCTSILSVNIIYLMVAGMRQNVHFMYIYPFYIPLINFSCQNIFKFSFCQIQCGRLKTIKSTFVLLHDHRGDVWLHQRDPLSGLRFALLFLGIRASNVVVAVFQIMSFLRWIKGIARTFRWASAIWYSQSVRNCIHEEHPVLHSHTATAESWCFSFSRRAALSCDAVGTAPWPLSP